MSLQPGCRGLLQSRRRVVGRLREPRCRRWRIMRMYLLARGLVTSKGIVTHDYPLEQWNEAIAVANSLDSIKVLMRPAHRT